jgi:carboxymethylenebutenolidase
MTILDTYVVSAVGTPIYVVRPEVAEPAPGVVILHEAWGLTEDVKALARSAAACGFVAAAPDLLDGYSRVRAVRDAARGHGPSFHRIAKVVEWLGSNGGADPDRTGAIGLSMGATMALRLATRGHFKVVAAYYGFTPPDEDLASCCPVVASYGDRDWLVRDQGVRLKKVLDEHGIPNDVKSYSDAGHSFLADPPSGPVAGMMTKFLGTGPSAEAAEDAWSRTSEFLSRHLSAVRDSPQSRLPLML